MLEVMKQKLVEIFGERVNFHRIERTLYSADIAALPHIITGQLKTLPDAVVQPVNKADLIALLNLSMKYKVPLVPRGAGSSGYGGVVPTRGGIVVDFYRMKNILEINPAEKTAAVEPGVVWNELEKELHNAGLSLRLYPGSALSSTVGGWLANGGGIGIGSYEYGYFEENVAEVEIITAQGIQNIKRSEIYLVNGMAGTTGIISRIKLLVRDAEKEISLCAAFDNLDDMVMTFSDLHKRRLPLWEIGYKDPLSVKYANEAIERQQKGQVNRKYQEIKLPQGKHIATFIYRASRASDIKNTLIRIIIEHDGEILSQEIATHEWEERFYGMRLKALGPSVVPSEVIIPLGKLPALVDRLNKKISSMAFSGTLVNYGKEVVFLGYMLDDERRRGFPLAYATSLLAIKEAQKLGGRTYTAGMLFAREYEQGKNHENLFNAFEFKNGVDPNGLLNPGKVFPASMDRNSPLKKFGWTMKLAQRQGGMVRTIDKAFGGQPPGLVINDKLGVGRQILGNETAWDAYACVGCGYCRSECTEFNAIGWESSSPRGKFRFLREYLKGKLKLDERIAEMFFVCTTCRRCNQVCQVMAPIDEEWTLTMRPSIWDKGFQPPAVFQAQAYNILTKHNPGGTAQSERKAWMPPDLKYEEAGEIAYWAGCSSTFNASTRNIAVNTVRILNKAGIKPVYLGQEEWCCGGALYTIGCMEEVSETVNHNLEEFHQRGVKTLITSCSGCWINYAHYYPVLAQKLNLKFDISVKHITEVMADMLSENKIKLKFPLSFKVTYHDPCHIGRGGGIYEPPRKILTAIPELELLEMPNNREKAGCCGRHAMRYPKIGYSINSKRIREAIQTGVPALIGACPTCETNLRQGLKEAGSPMEVLDITDLVAESMGLPTLVVAKLAKLQSGF